MSDEKLDDIRRAVADYMQSEGCDCCRDEDAHVKHEKKLAELLDVPKILDAHPLDEPVGHDFNQFSTVPRKS